MFYENHIGYCCQVIVEVAYENQRDASLEFNVFETCVHTCDEFGRLKRNFLTTCDMDYEYSLKRKDAHVVDNDVEESLQDKVEFRECYSFEIPSDI